MAFETDLAADAGRHSVSFGSADTSGPPAPYEVRRYDTDRHSTFTGALLTYLDDIGRRGVSLPSALAVAGAVQGDLVNITGSRWFLSLDGIAAVLGQRPRALNECAANAMALSGLADSDVRALPGPRLALPTGRGRYVLIGIGTGLGTAGLIGDGHRLHAVDSEAGHMRLTVETPDGERFAA